MSSRGQAESNVLQKNVEEQVERLLRQLADIEEMREDLDDDEYEEMKSETVQQLQEVKEMLAKTEKGDMSLVNENNQMQLTMQAAISSAFKTPQVIDLFAKKQPGQLRTRLSVIERDMKVGKLTKESYQQQKVEILGAVKKLGDKLSPEELNFLSKHGTASMSSFLEVSGDTNASDQSAILSVAETQIKNVKS